MNQTNSTLSRQELGCRTGAVSLVFNFLLFAGKLITGLLSNSISVIADSFNNLADCASSIITFLGFLISSKARDDKHPYGYGRMEYISAFIVSIFIFLTAFSLGRFSFMRLLDPQPVAVSPIVIIVPVIGVAVKLILACYIRQVNKAVHSVTLNANFKDNIADALVTTITILSIILMPITDFPLDGLIGLIVTLPLLWTGLASFLENLSLLIGKSLNTDLEKEIRDLVLSYEVFSKINSISVHDYGPENRISIIQVTLSECPNSDRVKNAVNEVTDWLKINYGLDSTIVWCSDCQMRKEGCSDVRTA